MKRNLILICFLIISTLAYSQVGITTPNPQGPLHVDGDKDNPPTGTPNAVQQLNDFIVTSNGDVGVGTIDPTTKLELNSGIADISGLKFTNLNAITPVTAGATLGVDASGNVVTVQGSSFTPAFGRVVLPSGVINVPTSTPNYNVLNFTLTQPGTYQITYVIRAQMLTTGGTTQGFASMFLSTAPSSGNIIENTEVLIYNVSAANDGGTGTGTFITSITAPTTYYVGVRSTSRDAQIINNGNGRSSVSFVKITP